MTVTMERMDLVKSVIDRLHAENKNRSYICYDRRAKGVVEFQVNWCCQGASSVEDTMEFVREVGFMAELANTLNALNIELDREDDELFKTEDDFDFWYQRIYSVIRLHSIESVVAFLNK